MNSRIKMALAASLALGGLGFAAQSASAMPMRGLDAGVATTSDIQSVQHNIQNIRYVCGYWGCHWVHRGYWGHPYWRHRYGWHRGWHHGWRHHGWHRWHR